MPDASLKRFLDDALVAPAVFELRPDYRVLLVVAEGLTPVAGDEDSEALLQQAEAHAASLLATTPVTDLDHVSAWREAYRAFGAKPQRTRNSLEALTRRAADGGLPRVNRLTDIYNAISVLHQIPLGGEDVEGYRGSPRLARATGHEPFDTVAGGADVTEHPEPGEVIWTDQDGVTCRRWNWRQGRRTHLSEATTAALFILDALQPLSDAELAEAGEHLTGHLTRLGPDVRTSTRLISRSQP